MVRTEFRGGDSNSSYLNFQSWLEAFVRGGQVSAGQIAGGCVSLEARRRSNAASRSSAGSMLRPHRWSLCAVRNGAGSPGAHGNG